MLNRDMECSSRLWLGASRQTCAHDAIERWHGSATGQRHRRARNAPPSHHAVGLKTQRWCSNTFVSLHQRAIAPETLAVRQEGAVLFAEISAPPMNLLGPELVRDLAAPIQQAEADHTVQVLVFKSADSDYPIADSMRC